jgi:hypothetical protein
MATRPVVPRNNIWQSDDMSLTLSQIEQTRTIDSVNKAIGTIGNTVCVYTLQGKPSDNITVDASKFIQNMTALFDEYGALDASTGVFKAQADGFLKFTLRLYATDTIVPFVIYLVKNWGDVNNTLTYTGAQVIADDNFLQIAYEAPSFYTGSCVINYTAAFKVSNGDTFSIFAYRGFKTLVKNFQVIWEW